jgi:hypothetical protein
MENLLFVIFQCEIILVSVFLILITKLFFYIDEVLTIFLSKVIFYLESMYFASLKTNKQTYIVNTNTRSEKFALRFRIDTLTLRLPDQGSRLRVQPSAKSNKTSDFLLKFLKFHGKLWQKHGF